ncbi:MAG: hypothetical protein ACI9TH_002913, partial [Kiritimatiellia bacterium]
QSQRKRFLWMWIQLFQLIIYVSTCENSPKKRIFPAPTPYPLKSYGN